MTANRRRTKDIFSAGDQREAGLFNETADGKLISRGTVGASCRALTTTIHAGGNIDHEKRVGWFSLVYMHVAFFL